MRIPTTILALVLAVTALRAQEDAPPAAKAKELKGTMVAYDAASRELTISLGGDNPRYETYALPADLGVAVDGREGTLEDLTGRRPVTLKVAADGETVISLSVNGETPRRARREADVPRREREFRRDGEPRREGEGRRDGDRREGGERDRRVGGQIVFSEIDRDHDGKITREELQAAFAGLDRDQDGILSADEIHTAVRARRRDNDGEVDEKGERRRDNDGEGDEKDEDAPRDDEKDEDE